MKHLLIFLFCLISLSVFGQEGFIETRYPRSFSFLGTNRLEHRLNDMRLDDEGLRNMFQENITSLNLLQTARRDKGIGVPLIIVGSAGLVSSLFFLNSTDSDLNRSDMIFHSSLLVGSIGSLFISSYTRNRLRAVNTYNRTLYEEMAFGDTEPLIELEYGQNPFRVFSYYQEGRRLNNRELTSLLAEHDHLHDLMRKANLQRGLGTGLIIAGSVGLLTGTFLLIEQDRTGFIIGGASVVSLISGGVLIGASRSNRQSAVNLYNKQLFQSATGVGRLDFNLNPVAGGLVLSF